jgi:flagellar hook-associated protein 3 FlgL
MFEQSVQSLNRQQSDFMQVGRQLASGRRVVNPSDDPQAASQAVGIANSIGVIEQYTDSRISARNSLLQAESVLASVSDAIGSAKTLMVQAINGTLSDTDRLSVATELEAIFGTVLGQANAADGSGRYLFGGFGDDSPPFTVNAAGNVEYQGDGNTRQQRVDSSRLINVSDNGERIFLSIQPGSGFIAEADAGNSGDVTFKGPGVIDPSDPGFGLEYEIDFVDDGGVISISINGGVATPYSEGEVISFGGLSLELEGEPQVGDRIVVDRAENRNTDIFETLSKALDVLQTPIETDSGRAALENTLNTVMRELDNSLDNVLAVRASVGGRLNELDVIDGVAESRILSYQTNLSGLMDLDYNEAIAEYSLRQIGLQAAQKSFVDVNGMSLFDYLR